MISEVLAAIPWFWPVTAATVAVAALASGPVARSLGTTRRHAFFLLVSVGGIVALTLTPAGHAGGRACFLSSPGSISIGEFWPLTERGLNVVLFMPLGVALGLVPRSRVKAEAVLLAALSPVMIESTQYLVRGLGRACEGTDVVDNLTGLGVGLLIAGLVGLGMRGRARDGSLTRRAAHRGGRGSTQ